MIFYLGFSKILCDNTIAIIARDGLELHFWKCDDKEIAKNTSCYIHVDNISDLHTEFAKNKVPNLGAPQVRAWGMTEMYILDLDGNLLKFGCQTP